MPELPVRPLHQGRTNGCGTAALAMALNCLESLKTGQPSERFTQAHLDRDLRAWDSFSSPGLLVKAARREGYFGGLYTQSCFDDIKRHIDQRQPVLALVSVDGTLTGLHYLVIYGYQETGNPEEELIMLIDPAVPPDRQTRTMSYETFVTCYWQPLLPFDLPTGINRTLLVFSLRPDLPVPSRVPLAIQMADFVSGLINVTARLFGISGLETRHDR